jgi:ornithine carbamoyltransferase
MVFDKPSTRTRVSFEVAMRELGGETIMLTGAEMQLGRGETIADTARVLARFLDAIMVRILSHPDLMELARYGNLPVINGLTKQSHPCQVMADVMTFEEHLGPIEGRTVAWSGDANNVLTSWVHAAGRLGFTINVATPANFAPSEELVSWAKANGAKMNLTRDAYEAVAGADAVITDCWVSMGDADEDQRRAALAPYQVDSKLMRAAAKHAVFMHCLPAHRGEEVTEDVIDGPRRSFSTKPRTAFTPKGVLCWCLAPGHLMPQAGLGAKPASRAHSEDDRVLPAVEALDLRGRVVRLGPTVDSILSHYAYPPQVARLLGEAVALAALLGSILESHGRFQLQTRSDGPVDMLVVDYDAPGKLRGFARFDAERVAQIRDASPAALFGRGHLALTIEREEDAARYQGVVPLEGESLAEAAHIYFRQSEQIPSFVRLAVAESVTPQGASWRAGGLLLQYLPGRARARSSARRRAGRGGGAFRERK